MRQILRGARIAAALMCFGLVACVLDAQSEIGLFQDFEFKNEESLSVRALSGYRASTEGATTRFMVVTPSGRAVVLTDIVRPREGTITTRILDDPTDTWLEIELCFNRGETLNEFFAANDAPQLMPLPVELRTSSGRRWVGTSSAPDDQGGYSIDLPRFSADLQGLKEELPLGFLHALTFLLDALPEEMDLGKLMDGEDQPPTTWSPLVKALKVLVGEDDRAASSIWRLTSGKLKKVLGDDDLAFLSSFRSVQNADPLSDFQLLLSGEERSP